MTSLSGCDIDLFLGFKDLKSKDLFSKSDPFAVIDIEDPKTKKWHRVGETQYMQDLATGKWGESFSIHFIFEVTQNIHVQVYDYDSTTNHDFIGEAYFTLGNLMGSSGQQLTCQLGKSSNTPRQGNRGSIIAYAEQKQGNGSLLRLRLSATKLDKKDFMGFGRSDPYYIIQRMVNSEWIPVFKSEWIKSNSNPEWKETVIEMDKLCKGNMDEQLKISVFDYDEGSKHDIIGDSYVTVKQLLSASGVLSSGFDIKHPPTKSKYQKASYVNSGVLRVAMARVEKSAVESFVEYLRGGLQINLITAIDFTGSNGDPRSPNSLHYLSQGFNQYQNAIRSVGDILAPYDHDGMIGAFGFGGVYNGAVSHCFPLSSADEVPGVDGVLQAYQQIIYNVPLSGPTYFAPVIEKACQSAFNPELSQNAQSYTVLLILTDGEVMDMQATVDRIVQGSQLGLSIVIVGVGSADFSKMEYLDGDNLILTNSRGTHALRDIVQFVPFTRCNGSGELLAKETLAEIPGQVVSFFQKKNIKPNPPVQVPSNAIPEAVPVSAPNAPPTAPVSPVYQF